MTGPPAPRGGFVTVCADRAQKGQGGRKSRRARTCPKKRGASLLPPIKSNGRFAAGKSSPCGGEKTRVGRKTRKPTGGKPAREKSAAGKKPAAKKCPRAGIARQNRAGALRRKPARNRGERARATRLARQNRVRAPRRKVARNCPGRGSQTSPRGDAPPQGGTNPSPMRKARNRGGRQRGLRRKNSRKPAWGNTVVRRAHPDRGGVKHEN